MPAGDPPDIPDGLTPAAKSAKAAFEKAYGETMANVRHTVALTILVWGPFPGANTPVARKRIEIRDKLITLGHYATFSEDIPSCDVTASVKSHEFAQALHANLIIILIEGAPGATAEFHDISSDFSILQKTQVMAPIKYRDGYSAKGAIKDFQDAMGGGCVHWYEDGDLEACRVLTHAVTRAEAIRMHVYRSRHNGAV